MISNLKEPKKLINEINYSQPKLKQKDTFEIFNHMDPNKKYTSKKLKKMENPIDQHLASKPLTPEQLNNIFVGPSALDFGVVFVKSSAELTLWV